MDCVQPLEKSPPERLSSLIPTKFTNVAVSKPTNGRLANNAQVMRAHRTNINQRATEANTSTVRPIHIYLLRFSDKVQILKVAANALKDNPFLDCQIFISDDVSKNVRKNRAKLRKDYLKGIKERSDVEFAFIPWSVPAQILFKDRNCSKLKSFKLPDE